jgi:predicted alpha-1,6-mannanase (GH76 family)
VRSRAPRWIALCGSAAVALVAATALGACGAGSTASGPGPSSAARASSAPAAAAPAAPSTTPLAAASAGAQAANATRARSALASFERAFYVASGSLAYWALDTSGGQATFYRQAEMTEVVEDAYAVSRRPEYRSMVAALLRGVVSSYGRSWLARPYNDDVLWMVIASLRAYAITGDGQYLAMARQNFAATYARGWSSDFGGGLWWTTSPGEKNVTTNAPAAIAACMLAADLHDPSYLAKAQRLYGWVRAHLYDARTGEVYDGVRRVGAAAVVRRVALTYNQGSFIGAADLLYLATGRRSYYDDALRTLQFTRSSLTHRGILPGELGGPDSNPGGFKGIFCRWAVKFTRDGHLSSFDAWFQSNADRVWSHRNAQGLMGTDWRRPTGSGLLYAWDCSSAVALLQAVAAR